MGRHKAEKINSNQIEAPLAGRKRIPDEIKALTGTLRKDRINELAPRPTGDLVAAPDYLSPGARAAWEYAIASAPPELLKRLDMSVLEVWACASDCYRAAHVALQTEGMIVKAPKTGVPMISPYLSIANNQAALLIKAAIEMGFTPASRTKVSTKQAPEKAVDGWADIVI